MQQPAPPSLLSRLSGHWWTVLPQAPEYVTVPAWSASWRAVPSSPFALVVHDERIGPVRLSGRTFVPEGARTLALVAHGLGGSSERIYVRRFALAAYRQGMAALCLNLRGADGAGEDFYHAGLWTDLHAALATEAARPFERIVLVGFSLGGHVVLRYASEPARDPRIRAAAAVCAPLDLDRGAHAIDSSERAFYRWIILSSLKQAYAAVAKRRAVPTPVRVVSRVRTLREWDRHTVVPRYGFASAEDYYARASVAPRLSSLSIPALLLYARHDPVVPWFSVEPALASCSTCARVVCIDRGAGHVGFVRSIDLGEKGELGLEPQMVSWLERLA